MKKKNTCNNTFVGLVMVRVILLLLFLFLASCTLSEQTIRPIYEDDTYSNSESNSQPCLVDCPSVELPSTATVITDAVYVISGDVTTIIPPATCLRVTSSPTMTNDFLVWMNKREDNCNDEDTLSEDLMLFHPTDGKLYTGGTFKSSESTITYVSDKNWIIIPVLGGSPQYYVLDATTFETAAISVRNIKSTVDSSILYLDDIIYMGTFNTPKGSCSNNPDCGTQYAIDADSGSILYQTDIHDVKTWWTGSPTTNGEFILSGGSEINDESDPGGCTSYKFDKDLTIQASIDPDIVGCFKNKEQGGTEDATAGELVFGADDSIWLLRTRPGDEQRKLALLKLDSALEEQCRAEWEDDTGAQAAALYYEGPTVDKEGNVYVSLTLPTSSKAVMSVHLYKVTFDCTITEIAEAERGAKSYATPSIAQDSAGDEYILFTVEDTLEIYTTTGALYKEYTLGDNTQSNTAPLVVDGMIYIVHMDGALDIIANSGLQSLSEDAYWPTFRHDQYRTADARTAIE